MATVASLETDGWASPGRWFAGLRATRGVLVLQDGRAFFETPSGRRLFDESLDDVAIDFPRRWLGAVARLRSSETLYVYFFDPGTLLGGIEGFVSAWRRAAPWRQLALTQAAAAPRTGP